MSKPGMSELTRRGVAGLLTPVVCLAAGLAAAGCGGQKPPAFNPGGPASAPATPLAQQAGPAGVTMPPFGPNAHIVMSGWRPASATLARAVLTDEDYQLAYLYAEYVSGQSDDWAPYVNPALAPTLTNALSAQAVTTESFKGTIRFFDVAEASAPDDHADVDVSGCVDTAQAVNTSVKTGAVLPGQSPPPDTDYYRFTDELAPVSGGQWQVVANYQPIYYPQAKECKP
jgi:hypothetical protein